MAAKKKSSRKQPAKARKRVAVPAPVVTQSVKPARSLFRLLPATISMAALLLVLKTIEIYQEGREISQAYFYDTAVAEDKPKEEAKPEEKKEEKPAEAAEAKKEEGHEGEKKEPLPPQASKEPPKPTPEGEGRDVPKEQQNYNPREVDILENLSARRQKIEEMERDVDLRAKVLEATEKRIDEKIAELNRLNKDVKDLIVVSDKEEDAKISSLVKIYEAMKPKDAARIFDEMDMDVLLMVIDRMNERRVAPVLAAMSAEKAKDVTQELAAQQKQKKDTIGGADLEGPPL